MDVICPNEDEYVVVSSKLIVIAGTLSGKPAARVEMSWRGKTGRQNGVFRTAVLVVSRG